MKKILALLASASMFASVAFGAGNTYTGHLIGNADTASALISPGWVFGSLTLTNTISQTSVTLTITNNVASLPSSSDLIGGRFIGASNVLGDFVGSGAALFNVQAGGISTNGGTVGQILLLTSSGTVWTNDQSIVQAGSYEFVTSITNLITGQITYTVTGVNTNQFLGAGTGGYRDAGNVTNLNLGANNIQKTNPILTKLANNSVRFNLIPPLTSQAIANGSWSGAVLGTSFGGVDAVAGSATYYQMVWAVPNNYSLGNTNCTLVVMLSSITNVVSNVSVRFSINDNATNSFNNNFMYVDRVLSIAASTGTTLGPNQMQYFTNSFMLTGTNDICVVNVTLNEQFAPTNRYGFFGGWADFSH
jgi:hypothetical protein